MRRVQFLSALFFLGVSIDLQAARIKDIAALRGQRNNTLTGYGLVIGLGGTGDKSLDMTSHSVTQLLKGFGVDPKSPKIDTKNMAAVVVTAVLPAFAKAGSTLDIMLSGVGNASSLDGGTLMVTPLKGADGNIYAVAQGRVQSGKKGDAGKSSGGAVTGTVPLGASLEKEIQYDWNSLKEVKYQLHHPDFTTAARMAKRINEELAGKYAQAVDAGTVDVIIPYSFEGTPTELIALIEWIDIEADSRARVVLNSKTGTVIMGENVRVLPVAIAHNGLKIEIGDPKGKKDPSGSSGKTKRLMEISTSGTSMSELVSTLNETGASSEELIQILQSLRSSGALLAEVEVQ